VETTKFEVMSKTFGIFRVVECLENYNVCCVEKVNVTALDKSLLSL